MTARRKYDEWEGKIGTYPCMGCGIGIECSDVTVRCCVNCREEMFENIAEIIVPGYDRTKMNDWPKEFDILWGSYPREVHERLNLEWKKCIDRIDAEVEREERKRKR